jgi:hypothetical protein
VPRGYIHEPSTQEALSIHITVGIYPMTWRDALAVALNQLADTDVRLRRAIPVGFFTESRSSEEQQSAQELIAEIAQKIDLTKAIDEIAQRFAATRATPSMKLSLSQTSEITCDSVVRCAAGLRWGPKSLWAPLPMTEVFWRLSEANSLRVREIGCGLSDQAMLTLAKRLVREGAFILERPD